MITNFKIFERNGQKTHVKFQENQEENELFNKIVNLLLYKKINIEDTIKYIKDYLSKGFDINKSVINGNTLLLYSIANCNSKIVNYIINKEADVNLSSDQKVTPLHFASIFNRVDIAKLLIKKGANIYAQDDMNENFYDKAKSSEMKKWIEDNYPEIVDSKKYNL